MRLYMKAGFKLILLSAAIILAGCRNSDARPVRKAIGALIVPTETVLPEQEQIYAENTGDGFTFNIDCAGVFFFRNNKNQPDASSVNFKTLYFTGDTKEGLVGASGSIAYNPGGENRLNAFYIYSDKKGIFFSPSSPIRSVYAENGKSLSYTEFPCTLSIDYTTPTDFFTLTCVDNSGKILSFEAYNPDDVTDYESIAPASGTDNVILNKYSLDGTLLETETLTRKNCSAVICYGEWRILKNKVIVIDWN